MSMHLEGPWLSTTGKKKGKKKFASADHARKARELKEEWERKQAEWASVKPFSSKPKKQVTSSGPVVNKIFVRDTGPKLASKPDSVLGPVACKAVPVYTGTKILGIGTMHKSNAVPIFSNDEAADIAKMRR